MLRINPLGRLGYVATALAFNALVCAKLLAAPIDQVPYASISGTGFIDFEDLPHIAAPGVNYDNVFQSAGTDFAERFVGQSLSFNGNFDVLSGAPSQPLALQVGAPGQNLNVYDRGSLAGQNVLTGLGPLGFPNFDAIGEGAISMLFDFDQSAFGFRLVGGNGGSATIDFYRGDGSLISSINLTGLADDFYGFARDGGVSDIAGVSIYNLDDAGVGFDELKFTLQGTPDPRPTTAPDGGGTLALLGIALACLFTSKNRRS